MRDAEEHLKRSGKRMATLVERIGPCGMTYTEPTFGSLARSIVYQQISIRAARSIHARLLETCGAESTVTPEGILRTTPEALRACGLSASKVAYITDLARKTADGHVEFARLPHLSDDEVIAVLTQVKGIGVWTAQMFLMFSLRRPDILPTGDLGIRNAVKRLDRLRNVPSPAEVERRGRKWRPYASVASWYLWRSLEPTGPF
jgi:DNA-3-methyladenine glycosylase II